VKLATYLHDGAESFGVVSDAGIVDVPAAWPDGPAGVLAALQAGEDALSRIADLAAAAETFIDLASVQLLAPIPTPPKVIGLAVNYVAHHNELDRGKDMPDHPRNTTTPRPFLMPATTVTGPDTVIPWPAYSRQIDYEVELAVVIGRTTKCVTPDEARACIAGYTIANDVSARSVTHTAARAERPKDAFFDWLHGKWADGFCPLGPWLVTADEIADPDGLDLELTVNGETRQKASTARMIFDVDRIVSFVSQLMTLEPGDVIATGTPSGVGAASGNFLAAGDVITCRIEGIGELTNTLGPEPDAFYEPCADTHA
jgi:2-keto-4-pentenoate hydratase/2-oxohepta-3-ene-1,7-dioic acid hydratase in catechol pathway